MAMPSLDERTLLLTRLDRQWLLHRRPAPVADAVHRLCALQSQEPVSPYLALWNRIEGFAAAELDRAYARADVVKATLMRITLHTVAAPDYPPFHAAMQPSLRASRLYDRRFTQTTLTADDADALAAAIDGLVGTPRTGTEIVDALQDRFGADATWLWWALRSYAQVRHLPADDATWTFGRRPRFGSAQHPAHDRDGGAAHLLARYLGAFGPATRADLARFTMLPAATIREALAALERDGAVRTFAGPHGKPCHDASEAEIVDADQPIPPRLLPMWDSLIMAYTDGTVVPSACKAVVTRRNGDQLPTLLVDGAAAGVWRILDGHVEASAFHRLPKATWAALDTEAAALLEFIGHRDPRPYARFHHWWDKGIPAAQVRRLGA